MVAKKDALNSAADDEMKGFHPLII
jgi:hypothetical protein